jgi:hypothetical protein
MGQNLAQLPEGCGTPDELALDFHYDCEALLSNFASHLSAELVAALADVNAAFANIPGDGWSEVAVRSAPEWVILSHKAGLALERLEQGNLAT